MVEVIRVHFSYHKQCTVNSTVPVSNQINESCFFEKKVERNKTTSNVQQILPLHHEIIQEFYKFVKMFL